MRMKKEVEAALQAHSAWREQFKDILNGRSTFDLAKISATDQCIFGKWLNNEGHRIIPSELHDEIRAVHQDFHRAAAEIIQKIKEKRFTEAREDISLQGALNQTSLRLRSLMAKLSFNPPAGQKPTLEQEIQEASEAASQGTQNTPEQQITKLQ